MTKAAELAKMGEVITNSKVSGRRNLVINGSMQVVQRGTSSTSTGFVVCDRFKTNKSGPDITSSQHTLSTSDTPYSFGLRSSYQIHITDPATPNTASDYAEIATTIESQDMAKSGWNYTSSSSNITLSFWVLATVSGTYTVLLRNSDANYAYTFNYTVTADTWKKVTHTISGNSNLVFNNDNGSGLLMFFTLYYGTNYTATATNETWAAFDSSVQVGDYAQNILATDEAKFEITGIQLEVGSQATPFEHRSLGEEKQLCYRYYYRTPDEAVGGLGVNEAYPCYGNMDGSQVGAFIFVFPVPMRAPPTAIEQSGTPSHYSIRVVSDSNGTTGPTATGFTTEKALVNLTSSGAGKTSGDGAFMRSENDDGFIAFSADL